MTQTILDFLASIVTLVGRNLPDGWDFAIVVANGDGIQFVGGDMGSPSRSIDMLISAAQIMQETHEREEGHA